MQKTTASFRKSWRLVFRIVTALATITIAFQFFTVVKTTKRHGGGSRRAVAISFDDGPNPRTTDQILEVLKRNQIRATFFLLGRNIEMHQATARAIYEGGHEIGNHTYQHPALAWAGFQEIATEIEKTDRLIADLGYRGKPCFRAPYGTFLGALPIFLWWKDRRHCLFSGQSTPPDYLRPDPTQIASSLAMQAEPGSVLLLHDGEGDRSETVTALELLIRGLRNRNFEFQTVSELLWR